MRTAGPVQFELFGGLPFVEYMPTEAVPEVRYTPAEPVPEKRKPVRVGPFEKWLRKLEVPYVAVTEAKRAVFVRPGESPEAFDFLIYNECGPNLLVLLGTPTAEGKALMREWEGIFGKGFAAYFVWRAGERDPQGQKEWVGALLEDYGAVGTVAIPVANLLLGAH